MFTGLDVTLWKCPSLSQGIRWMLSSQCELLKISWFLGSTTALGKALDKPFTQEHINYRVSLGMATFGLVDLKKNLNPHLPITMTNSENTIFLKHHEHFHHIFISATFQIMYCVTAFCGGNDSGGNDFGTKYWNRLANCTASTPCILNIHNYIIFTHFLHKFTKIEPQKKSRL